MEKINAGQPSPKSVYVKISTTEFNVIYSQVSVHSTVALDNLIDQAVGLSAGSGEDENIFFILWCFIVTGFPPL